MPEKLKFSKKDIKHEFFEIILKLKFSKKDIKHEFFEIILKLKFFKKYPQDPYSRYKGY
ncbi:zona pellucida sperm-binding protein 2 [Helicobacter pylori]|nr:zona pellucida sperm-binding protein 2 [Helicobacter pylori]